MRLHGNGHVGPRVVVLMEGIGYRYAMNCSCCLRRPSNGAAILAVFKPPVDCRAHPGCFDIKIPGYVQQLDPTSPCFKRVGHRQPAEVLRCTEAPYAGLPWER